MNKNAVILIVDDERNHADGIAEALEKYCAQTITAYDAKDALQALRDKKIDIVITDLKLKDDIDGLNILEEAKRLYEDIEVILMTAYGSIDTCKQAIKQGAYDYLTKPIDIDQLRTFVEQLSKKISQPTSPGAQAAKTLKDRFQFEGVKGKSPAIAAIFEVLRRVSASGLPVLIEGPSGTGKELLARAVHNNSLRSNKLFRPINCAGLSETLLESELFGHAKGAFTGAAANRKGLFEIADKGTIFLDEIGDMPMTMQAKLLRVLEDGIVMPVGSNKPIVVDVRIVSATNHDLTKLIEQKKFREDLYFRIKGVSVTVPALRDRAEDIPAFVEHFAKEATAETGAKITGMTEAALAVLMSYDWPGNLRQLRNCVRTMVVMCEGEKLDVRDIPAEVHQIRQLAPGRPETSNLAGIALNKLEKQAIVDTLAKTNNNRQLAAKILGIGERTLYRKIKEYNL